MLEDEEAAEILENVEVIPGSLPDQTLPGNPGLTQPDETNDWAVEYEGMFAQALQVKQNITENLFNERRNMTGLFNCQDKMPKLELGALYLGSICIPFMENNDGESDRTEYSLRVLEYCAPNTPASSSEGSCTWNMGSQEEGCYIVSHSASGDTQLCELQFKPEPQGGWAVTFSDCETFCEGTLNQDGTEMEGKVRQLKFVDYGVWEVADEATHRFSLYLQSEMAPGDREKEWLKWNAAVAMLVPSVSQLLDLCKEARTGGTGPPYPSQSRWSNTEATLRACQVAGLVLSQHHSQHTGLNMSGMEDEDGHAPSDDPSPPVLASEGFISPPQVVESNQTLDPVPPGISYGPNPMSEEIESDRPLDGPHIGTSDVDGESDNLPSIPLSIPDSANLFSVNGVVNEEDEDPMREAADEVSNVRNPLTEEDFSPVVEEAPQISNVDWHDLWEISLLYTERIACNLRIHARHFREAVFEDQINKDARMTALGSTQEIRSRYHKMTDDGLQLLRRVQWARRLALAESAPRSQLEYLQLEYESETRIAGKFFRLKAAYKACDDALVAFVNRVPKSVIRGFCISDYTVRRECSEDQSVDEPVCSICMLSLFPSDDHEQACKQSESDVSEGLTSRKSLESNEVLRLGCGHELHYSCSSQWFHFSAFCPYCRTPIVKQDDEN